MISAPFGAEVSGEIHVGDEYLRPRQELSARMGGESLDPEGKYITRLEACLQSSEISRQSSLWTRTVAEREDQKAKKA